MTVIMRRMATRSVAAAVEAGQKPTYENCVFCLTGRTRRRGRGGRHGGRRARCDRVADGTAGRRAAWGTAGCRAARTPLPTCRFIRVWSALYRCRGVCVLVGISATPCSCSEWSRERSARTSEWCCAGSCRLTPFYLRTRLSRLSLFKHRRRWVNFTCHAVTQSEHAQ